MARTSGREEMVGRGDGGRHRQSAVLQVGHVRLPPVLLQSQEGAARRVRVRRPAALLLGRRRSSPSSSSAAAAGTQERIAAEMVVEQPVVVGRWSGGGRYSLGLSGGNENIV